MFCSFMQLFFIQSIPIMMGITIQKRVSDGMIPHLIDIFFSFAGVSCVKIIIYLLTAMYCNVGRQKVIQRCYQSLFRNAVLQFHADAILICMYTRICSAATFQIRLYPQNVF